MPKKCTPLWREHIWKSKCTKHLIFGRLLEVEMSKKCTPLWREKHLKFKMHKTREFRHTFGSWDLEKIHAVVVRSTFRSQKYKNFRGTRHFWAFRCRFVWQAQGIVHLVKSEPNVRVLWQFQLQTLLNYTRLHYTTATTTTTTTLHYTTLHYTNNTALHYTKSTLLYTTIQLHYATLNYTTYTTIHYTTLHYTHIRLHYTTLHYTTLHLHLHLQLQLKLHYITLDYTNYITPQLQLHYTTTTATAALHHTASSSCGWGDRPGDIVTTPKNIPPTTFQSISGFALPSVIHNSQPLL